MFAHQSVACSCNRHKHTYTQIHTHKHALTRRVSLKMKAKRLCVASEGNSISIKEISLMLGTLASVPGCSCLVGELSGFSDGLPPVYL